MRFHQDVVMSYKRLSETSFLYPRLIAKSLAQRGGSASPSVSIRYVPPSRASSTSISLLDSSTPLPAAFNHHSAFNAVCVRRPCDLLLSCVCWFSSQGARTTFLIPLIRKLRSDGLMHRDEYPIGLSLTSSSTGSSAAFFLQPHCRTTLFLLAF